MLMILLMVMYHTITQQQTQTHDTYSATVCFGLVDALHGQHVINARVQAHLIDYGDASLLSTGKTCSHD